MKGRRNVRMTRKKKEALSRMTDDPVRAILREVESELGMTTEEFIKFQQRWVDTDEFTKFQQKWVDKNGWGG
jgi:hypothetical protein